MQNLLEIVNINLLSTGLHLRKLRAWRQQQSEKAFDSLIDRLDQKSRLASNSDKSSSSNYAPPIPSDKGGPEL